MSSKILRPAELRERGFEALVAALGWAHAVRFLQQYESGQLNYSKDRDSLLPDWDAETMVRNLRNLPAAVTHSELDK